MILFFVLLISIITVIVLLSLFEPRALPWYKPHLMLTSSEIEPIRTPMVHKQPLIMEGLVDPEPERNRDISSKEKVDRLENILIEKNIAIDKLQKQVAAEKSHRTEFAKVQKILEEEITKLRAQNKKLKLKTGEDND